MFNIETAIIWWMVFAVGIAVAAVLYAYGVPRQNASAGKSGTPRNPVQDGLDEVEGLVARGRILIGLHLLKYGETKEFLDEAEAQWRFVTARTKVVDITAPGEESNLLASLKHATRLAERALFLAEAEKDEQLHYYCSVRKLLGAAAQTANLDLCLQRLRDAVKQAESPDASEEPDDLARALAALALVTWQDLKAPGEAEVIYARVMACDAGLELRMEVTSDLTHLYADDGQFDKADRMAKVEFLLAARLGRGHEVKARTLVYLAVARAELGGYQEAIGYMTELRELAEGSEDVIARSYQLFVLKKLAEYNARLSNFTEAEQFYDAAHQLRESMFAQPRPDNIPAFIIDPIDTTEQRQLLADTLEAVGKIEEASAVRASYDPTRSKHSAHSVMARPKTTALQRRREERLRQLDPRKLCPPRLFTR